jgi:hypothetical protein
MVFYLYYMNLYKQSSNTINCVGLISVIVFAIDNLMDILFILHLWTFKMAILSFFI